MRKNNYFGLIAMSMGLGFIMLFACSKDDGCETKTYYLDKDMDNYGISRPTMACKPPVATVGQYVTQSGDPDDTNADIFPGCVTTNYYVDDDGDGFGTGDPIASCVELEGKFSTVNGDCNDDDSSINPDVFTIYYPDNDGDGHGDLNGETISISGCNEIPEGYVANNTDCDDENTLAYPGAEDITYYLDADKDGYGFDDEFETRGACEPAPEFDYALQGGDCNDSDDSIYPDAGEIPNDGIDSNCDGVVETVIWTGADDSFTKAANADWAKDPFSQDQLTENIYLTRSTEGYITNIQWWVNVIGAFPDEANDLPWEYYGRKAQNPPSANVGDVDPSGGPQGIRWAILEQGGNTAAWDNFDWYGELGDPTHYYSLNNIVTICALLNDNETPLNIVDDFGIDNTIGIPQEAEDYTAGNVLQNLENVTLGVWLVEDDIYFTLTFTELPFLGGGAMSYTRSTP